MLRRRHDAARRVSSDYKRGRLLAGVTRDVSQSKPNHDSLTSDAHSQIVNRLPATLAELRVLLQQQQHIMCYVSLLIIVTSLSDVIVYADASKYGGDVRRSRDSLKPNLLASDNGQFLSRAILIQQFCPSVCPSHFSIASKRLNISSLDAGM